MVAYSFQKRSIEPIEPGLKTQTIRGGRRRHAHPGAGMSIALIRRGRWRRTRRDLLDWIIAGLIGVAVMLTSGFVAVVVMAVAE